MLSALETWINDKWYVARDGINEAEQKVAG